MKYQVKKFIGGYLASVSTMVLVFALSFISIIADAKQPAVSDTLQRPLLKVLKKLELSGTIRMRYTSSLENNIDVNGKEHSADKTDEFTTNAFALPQVRLVLSGNITDKLDVYFRANFADFAQNPQNKVLEYAYATYHFNKSLALRAGLFRPEFGREDDIATDFLQSFDYTNQYNAFAENGWMSYQLGLSLLGKTKVASIPVTYSIGVFNGNGREGFTDSDNGKQVPARVTAEVIPGLELGLNGGFGKSRGNSVQAWGVDLNYEKKLNERLLLAILSEYKDGSNQSLLFNQSNADLRIKDYKVRGVYVLPSVQYKVYGSFVKAVEASFKYEYLDPSYVLSGSNVRQQYIPMLGIDCAEKYAVRLQVGMVIDHYGHNVENSVQYNSSRFLTQLQLRF